MNIKRFFSKTIYFIRRYILRLKPHLNTKTVPKRPKKDKNISNKLSSKQKSQPVRKCYWNNNKACPSQRQHTGTAYTNELVNSLSCCKVRQSIIYSEYALWFENKSKNNPLYKLSDQQIKKIEKTLERYKKNNPEEYQMVVDKVHQHFEH